MLTWARRLGKDETALNLTAKKLFGRVGAYWHMLPEYAQCRKAVWDRVDRETGKKILERIFPPEIRKKTNDTEMKITFRNGSIWQLCGSDNYNSLVGSDVLGMTFSEWALSNPAAWAYLGPILEENGGWALFISTLRGKNHHHDLGEYAKKQPDWFFSSVNALESGVFTAAQLEKIRAALVAQWGEDEGTVLFEQEYMNNEQVFVLGSIYAREMAAAHDEGRIRKVEFSSDYPVYTVWDLGVDDKTFIIFAQFFGGKIWILKVYENRGFGAEHYAGYLKSQKEYKYETLTLPHDGANKEWGSGRTRREVLAGFGFDVEVQPAERVIDGINAARAIFPLCVFDEQNCRPLINALTNYKRKYDEKKKIYGSDPLHDWTSHGCDSFRYLALMYNKKFEKPLEKENEKPAGITFNDLMEQRIDENGY